MSATVQKWLWAALIAGIVIYYAWKYSSKTGPVTVGTGNPSTGPAGLTLAENPSTNPFRDLFAAVGTPAAQAAQAPAAASPSTTPIKPTNSGSPRLTPTTTDSRPSTLALFKR